MFTKNAHHHHHTIESDRICRSGRSKISYWTFVCSGEYDVKRESAVNPLFFFLYFRVFMQLHLNCIALNWILRVCIYVSGVRVELMRMPQ